MASAGTNYGLNTNFLYTEFEFDSGQATSANNPQFSKTDWPVFLIGRPLNNVAAIKVLEVQIPFTYYVFFAVQGGNGGSGNHFLLQEYPGGVGGPTVVVTLTPGNYTVSDLIAQLQFSLSTVSPNGWAYTVTYAPITQKLTITSNGGNGSHFNLAFGNDINDPGWLNPRLWLGFFGGVNVSTIGAGAGPPTLVSPFVLQVTGPNYLFLNSYSLGPLCKLYLPANYQAGGQVSSDGTQLAKIPVTVQPGGVNYWSDPAPQYWFDLENQSNIAQLDFYLTMGTNPQPITLNGATFSLKLGILTTKQTSNDYVGGGSMNNRVVNRIGPPGQVF